MIDYTNKKSSFSVVYEYPIATGYNVNEEGLALVKVLEGGVKKIKPSEGTLNEVFAGFSKIRGNLITNRPMIETGLVPAAAPYTIALSNVLIVLNNIRIYDNTGAVGLALGNPANAGEYSIDINTGVITFNVAQKEHNVTIYYRHSLTALDAQAIYFQDPISRGNPSDFDNIACGLIAGQGIIYTDKWDVTADFTASKVCIGPNGYFTTKAKAANGTVCGSVETIPTPDFPFLGIAYTISNLD